jgi:serine protease Do
LSGTGFVVADSGQAKSNLVVTNAHVLPLPADIDPESTLMVQVSVGSNEFQMRMASVLEVDRVHDLVLLRFEGASVPAFTVRESDSVQEGQSVAFIGFPIGGALGFSPVTHRGMVSSIAAAALPSPSAQKLNEKTIRSLRNGERFNVFQLDGTAYPGNSGGPLFDPDTGDVVGVLNMVFIKGTRESALTNPSGISYAIPSRYVLEMLQRHKAN